MCEGFQICVYHLFPSNTVVVAVLIAGILQRKALTTHHAISHLGRRDFVCAFEECGRAFGYKHILQRHQARQHGQDRTAAEEDEDCEHHADADGESSEAECPQPKKRKSRRLQSQNISLINEITGVAYEERTANTPAPLRCPHPAMEGLPSAPSVESLSNLWCDATPCEYVFGRAYDMRRHLRAIHGVELDKETVDGWARKIRVDDDLTGRSVHD
jgi:general transcription factor IIIA